LEFYSISSFKQQSGGKYLAPLGHIILIPSQPVFALWCCVLIREATNTKFIGFGLILPEFEPMVFRTRGEQVHHYITDAVILNIYLYFQFISVMIELSMFNSVKTERGLADVMKKI
jgi:hypothetical protein